MSERLRGRVTRVTLQRLKSGEIRHDTRIEFAAEEAPWLSVRVKGFLPPVGWDEKLLAALNSRYDVDGLPKPRWVGKAA